MKQSIDRAYISGMNLRDLDYLVAVAETGQFALAARRCHVSQPTLSMQLRKLEEELGLVLFERGPRGAVPTAEARPVVAQARLVLEEVGRLRELARSGGDPLSGTLRLGVIPTVGPYLLPQVLPAVRKAHPGLRLLLREAPTARLLDELASGELEAAILSPPFDERGLVALGLGRERFLMALPSGHALAGLAEIPPEALAGETVLMLEQGHCFREQAMGLCTRLGLRPGHEVEAGSVESLRQMVSVGLGMALLPELATAGPFAQGAEVAIRHLAHEDAARELALVSRRSFPHRAALEAIASLLAGPLRDAPPRAGAA
ncbi:LysR substrate-binding domain-containing protein [Geminicoccaceae bacterium 1502E]|nr:LysR substrate-binding domain-containing protein [Geminicoccaceae bacterium 1502E]